MRINNAMDRQKNKSLEEILRPGEMCVTTNGKLFFCFGDRDVKELDFNEKVTNEKAEELIQAIKLFFERR